MTYGLSKEKNSFLYDPQLTMRVTCNGQLLLSMLIERLCTEIPDAQLLMANTDGSEIKIPRKYENLYTQICKEWEKQTELELEFVDYKKMIIADVNNYIAVYQDDSVKCKGRFEYENLPLHKNSSMLIVPKALYMYFIHGVDPKVTIESSNDIFEFCIGAKLKGAWFFIEQSVQNGLYVENKHKKLLRYFVSNKGVKIIKCHTDGRKIQLHSGKEMQTILNNIVPKPFAEYDIDKSFYLRKVYEEIRNIEGKTSSILPSHNKPTQLKLF